MIPPKFDYYQAGARQEAISQLSKLDGNGRLLAGGMSLIPLMKLRLISPGVLIDINRIKDLSYIKRNGDKLEIGAMTRYSEIEDSELIKNDYPILWEAVYVLGDIHVRHMGTVGGALAHADPASDVGTALLALGAEMKVVSSKGERTVGIDNFFVDTFATSLARDEMLTGVVLPKLPKRTGTAYMKFSRCSGDFGVVTVGTVLTFLDDARCSSARIAVGGAGPTIFRAHNAENALLAAGHLTSQVVEEASRKAAEDSKPASDLRGSTEYKREMVQVYTRRGMLAAMSRAKVK
jgi:carbon-monoxide dehydrogenase medium subunit